MNQAILQSVAPPGNGEATAVHVHNHLAPPPVVTSLQLAEIVGCSRETVQKRLDVARVPFTNIGKARVYAWADVIAVIRDVGASQPKPATRRGKLQLVATKQASPTAADIARANGLTVKGPGK